MPKGSEPRATHSTLYYTPVCHAPSLAAISGAHRAGGRAAGAAPGNVRGVTSAAAGGRRRPHRIAPGRTGSPRDAQDRPGTQQSRGRHPHHERAHTSAHTDPHATEAFVLLARRIVFVRLVVVAPARLRAACLTLRVLHRAPEALAIIPSHLQVRGALPILAEIVQRLLGHVRHREEGLARAATDGWYERDTNARPKQQR